MKKYVLVAALLFASAQASALEKLGYANCHFMSVEGQGVQADIYGEKSVNHLGEEELHLSYVDIEMYSYNKVTSEKEVLRQWAHVPWLKTSLWSLTFGNSDVYLDAFVDDVGAFSQILMDDVSWQLECSVY